MHTQAGDNSCSSQQDARAILLLQISLQSAFHSVFRSIHCAVSRGYPTRWPYWATSLLQYCSHTAVIFTVQTWHCFFCTMSLWVVTMTWWLLMLQRSYGLVQKYGCHSTYPSASSLHTVTCSSMTLCYSHLAESTLLPQPYWEHLCFTARFLTTLGTSAVTTTRELLTGWALFPRRMHWHFWQHLSVLQKSFICCEKFDALLKQAIQCITNSDLSELQWIQASLPVRDGGLVVRRVFARNCPFWILRQAHSSYRTTSWLTVSNPRATFYSCIWQFGQRNLVMFRTHNWKNSRSGIALVCSKTNLSDIITRVIHRSFQHASPHLWNQLPTSLKIIHPLLSDLQLNMSVLLATYTLLSPSIIFSLFHSWAHLSSRVKHLKSFFLKKRNCSENLICHFSLFLSVGLIMALDHLLDLFAHQFLCFTIFLCFSFSCVQQTKLVNFWAHNKIVSDLI